MKHDVFNTIFLIKLIFFNGKIHEENKTDILEQFV